MRQFTEQLGARFLGSVRGVVQTAAVSAELLRRAARPSGWPRTTRNVLARQILFTGVDAVGIVGLLGLLVGVSVVLQAQVWLSRLGQTAAVGPILAAVLIREMGPLLVNFIVIGRSGTAIASELSSMRVNGEIRVLEAQGLDPLAYLLVPRAIGVAASVFGLTILFVFVAFAGGYTSGWLMGAEVGQPALFVQSIARAVRPVDIGNLLAKTLIPGFLTGILCSIEGLSVRGAATEIPQAATRGVVHSVRMLFITSVLISLVTYL
ncbi:MAG: ABC transporter permease [Kiritimatiellae bacterium]|nr:ABC transporter permease [Kiritimatiellia bacterium]